MDVLRERAERADQLELEMQRMREKLSDADFFKTRVEELREDNRMLQKTKYKHTLSILIYITLNQIMFVTKSIISNC